MLVDPVAASGAAVRPSSPQGALPPVRAGSISDAKRLRGLLQQLLAGLSEAGLRLDALVAQAKAKAVWLMLERPGGGYFASWEELCTCPLPHGLGVPAAAIELVLAERRDHALQARLLAADARPLLPSGQHRTPETEHTTVRKPPGTSSAYLVARLARDRPEYIERLRAGEFTSAYAAAIDAGIAPPMFTLRLEPVTIARQLLKRLTAADVQRVVDLLTDPSWLNGPLGNPRCHQALRAARAAARPAPAGEATA